MSIRQPFRKCQGNGEDVRGLRESLGLKQSQPGIAKCLQCARDFQSWDVTRNRVCKSCHNLNMNNPTPECVYDGGSVYDGDELEEIHAA